MNRTWRIALAALALAIVLGVGLQDSFARDRDGFRDSLNFAQAKELRQMHRAVEDKCFELMELFAGKTVDAGKAKALQQDMQELRNKMGAFWLDAALAYKQTHPDWTPHFGAMMGMGGHGMGGRGWGGHDRGERDWGGHNMGGHGPALYDGPGDDE